MQTFFATLLVIASAMFVMALGVMVTGRALKGSCGGTGINCVCSPEEQQECRRKKAEASPA